MTSKENSFRIETDTMGEIKVLNDKYWGAQTQRSYENFNIGSDKMPKIVIESLAIVKRCAAAINKNANILEEKKANLIIEVAEEIISGKLDEHFPLLVWQTGSGTQTNMNVNEVISNRAIEKIGGVLGSKIYIHPNDDVNKGQSTNDSFPTAMNIAIVLLTNRLLFPALNKLKTVISNKIKDFSSVIKIGRTHLQDATPLTLGQEFSGYLAQIERAEKFINETLEHLYYLAQGATAVGTGINTFKGFDTEFAKEVSLYTKMPFKPATNKFAAIASHDDIVQFSGSLNSLATALNKIASDIRFLSCGPKAGIAEITIPANEPGSSIMPGKTNPTQIEALTMICYQVLGNHVAVTLGGMQGQLELNVYKPLIINNVVNSITLLSNAIQSFSCNCLMGVEANTNTIQDLMEKSLMLVTALNKHIGYDNAAKIAKYAYKNQVTLKKAALELKLVSSEDFNKWVDPKNMI